MTQVSVSRAVLYTVTLVDYTGDARQADADLRPRYRAGAVPQVDFDGSQALVVNATQAGPVTILILKPDNTMEVQAATFVAGPNVLPAVDFNQVLILPGAVPNKQTLVWLRESLRSRVQPVVLLPPPGRVLLSGDEQAGGSKLLLSGDEQTGGDSLLLSGDQA